MTEVARTLLSQYRTWICDLDGVVSTATVRSSAWIWDFSSTHGTTAFSRGARSHTCQTTGESVRLTQAARQSRVSHLS